MRRQSREKVRLENLSHRSDRGRDEAEWGKLADLVEKIEAIIKKASSSGYPDRFLGQEE